VTIPRIDGAYSDEWTDWTWDSYSCRQGICGACACQLTGGEVEMAHNEVLEAADIADGYILACQAVPLTPEVGITY
jgi:3-ketosteroid 9alpha-monooxygenase subunit B